MAHRHLAAVALALAGCACGGSGTGSRTVLPFGDSVVIVDVNPVVNTASTAAVPASGTERAGIVVDVNPGGSGTTDATGFAQVGPLEAGDATITVGTAAPIPFAVPADGDVFDHAVAYDGATATPFPNFPIRYAAAGRVVIVGLETRPGAIAQAVATSGAIVVFRPGTYVGDLTVSGTGVILLGEDVTGQKATIDGTVTVSGTGVRLRGFRVTGDVRVTGNDFGMAFNTIAGTTRLDGNGIALLKNVLCGGAAVSSGDATLVDDAGADPVPLPAGACP